MQKLFHKTPAKTEYEKFMMGFLFSMLGILFLILGLVLKVPFLWILGLIVGIPATFAWLSRTDLK